nr:hypothetical protein [Tanacetum cinerariifolium]
VLVAKPHNKTSYELLTGDKPAIGYLKPFRCQVTILNTSDYLGKFDEKADEGYIVGYSIPGKAYRVYNLMTGKIMETMNIKFLENLPSVEGTSQPWLFDIDYLTDSLNYARIRNTNLTAGNQSLTSNNAGCPDLDSDSDDEQDTQEQDGKDAAQRLGLAFPTHVVTHKASSIPAEKSSSVSPAITPTASAGNTPPVYPRTSADRLSKSTGKQLASSSKTPIPADRSVSAGKLIPADLYVSVGKPISADRSVSAGKPILADRSVFAGKPISADESVSDGKPIPADRSVSADKSISADRSISASRVTNSADRRPSKLSSNVVSERFLPASNTQNSDIHDGLKLFDCPSTGIFSSSSYDDEYHGPDISNQEKEILVNSVTSKKVNKDHPHSLIIGDLHTPVQTRKKAKAYVPTQNAFVSYIQDQRRNNHTDFHLCLFSYFLSQMEPTSVAHALLDPDWAMQEELQQFQNQSVWVLVELPEEKHAIGTKWIL